MKQYKIDRIIDEALDAESQIIIIEDAFELLKQGFPLDTETELALESIGVDPDEFTYRFQEQATSGLRAEG